ncbi:unnamed protein product [Cochlearia groenlandica]
MPNEQVNCDGDRLSPAVGSATDRASVPKPAVMPIVPPSAPGSSSHPGGQVRKDSPPKRLKISAKSVLDPIGTKKKSKIPKEKKPKTARPIHFFTSSKSKLSGSLAKCPPIYPFPSEYLPFKEKFLQKEEVPWVEVVRQQQYLAGEEEEERLADEELDISPPRVISPTRMEESVDLGAKSLSPRARSPASEVKSPPPTAARTSPFDRRAYLSKRVIETVEGEVAGSPSKRARVEPLSIDAEVRHEGGTAARPDIVEGVAKPGRKDGVSSTAEKMTGPAKLSGGPSRSKAPLAEEEFGYRLSETNDHGFEFFYNGAMPYVNHAEASASFQYGVYSAIHGEEFPNGLVFAEEMAQLARLEQRVSGLEKDLQLLRKEKKSRKLKERLSVVELENADLKKKLEVVTESSKARDLALEESREAVGVVSAELAVLKERCDGLCAHHSDELARLRRSRSEHVAAAKVQLARLRDASEARLGRLKAYLDEEAAIADKYLLFNQMRGVFGTMEQLKTQYAVDTPPIFERQCRDKEDMLRRWLEDRKKFSYEPSDFVLPSDIEIDVPEEVSEPEDEAVENVAPDAGRVVDREMAEAEAAGNEAARDEVAGDANLLEESEAVRRDE